MTDGTLLMRSSDLLSRSYADEVLLALPEGGEVALLGGSAAVVWDLLEEPRSLGDVIATLCRFYETPSQRIERDVEPLVRDMVERGWVVEIQDSDD